MEQLGTQKKKTYRFINYLKAIAVCLIVNSHFDVLYPISALATGGAIGNAIFFAASGFCLMPVTQKFPAWFGKKFQKLYIPTFLMALIALLLDRPAHYTLFDGVKQFLWPTRFWFVGAILLFYVLFYLVRKVQTKGDFAVLAAVLAAIYLVYYVFLLDTSAWVIEANGLDTVEGLFKLVFYFGTMMLGKFFWLYGKDYTVKKGVCAVHALAAFVSLYGMKFLMAKIPWLMHLQFLNHVSILWFLAAVFLLAMQWEDALSSRRDKVDHTLVSFLSSHSLCIYVVQFHVIRLAAKLPFPVNVPVAIAAIILAAVALQKLSGLLSGMITKLLHPKP